MGHASSIYPICFVLIFFGIGLGTARADLVNTLHNLTPSGSGDVKNPDPVGLCRFCHTPHRAGQTRALWNRNLPNEVYDLYQSSTIEAALQQPTGASRLCLSCHDGTIALDAVLAPGSDIVGPLGSVEGRVLLGTDLRDDHPISFIYDEALAARNGELVSPTTLTGPVRLDRTDQVQCSSCHDPHSDVFPKFLVMSVENGNLCTACHLKDGWPASSHANSTATWNGAGEDPWPESALATVGQNACLSCHDPHSAAHPERLLRREFEEDVCLVCHSGNVADTDVAAELLKTSHHPIVETSGIHDPPEDPLTMDRHVSCVDCHNPHAVAPGVPPAPLVPGVQQFVRGVDISGAAIEEAQYAYEVCFKCHGLSEAVAPRVVRQDDVTNVRLETHPGNASFHPITAVGTNPDVVSLIPPLTPSSRITCHDCHNTDEKVAPSPTTAFGPHGSDHESILERQYPLHDFIEFDESEFALCFKCHSWDNGLRDDSAFEHKKHMENADAACGNCHDPHGSRSNTHLINFLRFDEYGTEVVRPLSTGPDQGRLEFNDLGDGRGQCYLTCHNVDHCPRIYAGPDKDKICECDGSPCD